MEWEQINTPAIFIEATFAGMPKTYRDLGELFGDNARTEELAKYCEETLELCERRKRRSPRIKSSKHTGHSVISVSTRMPSVHSTANYSIISRL